MSPLFDGLEAFGLKVDKDLQIYEEEQKKNLKKPETKVVKIEDSLYDRTVMCPSCNHEIAVRTVKNGANKLEGTGTNLRPIYTGIDAIVYDIVMCDKCGYTALNRHFKKLTERQMKIIKEEISSKIKAPIYPPVYSYKDAFERYRLALYCDTIIGRRAIDKAYLMLKTSWVIESLLEETTDPNERQGLKETYQEFVTTAYEGFYKSYESVTFPIFGMNKPTYDYLLAALAFEMGDMKQTGFWLGKVLLSNVGHARLKEKARELKEKIDQSKEANE